MKHHRIASRLALAIALGHSLGASCATSEEQAVIREQLLAHARAEADVLAAFGRGATQEVADGLRRLARSEAFLAALAFDPTDKRLVGKLFTAEIAARK